MNTREEGDKAAVGCSPTHSRAYCLLGFETLKDLEFRNREGECVKETISAPNRRSRGSSRRLCPSGSRFRRSSSPARGMSPIPGRACSCWTSRGGYSASRGSERHTGISFDGARPALPQPCRTESAPRASSPPESSTMRSTGTARPPEAHARYISSEDATRNAFTTSCSACGRWA